MKYTLIEKPSRVYAVDENDIEICGARQPYGHNHWLVHTTIRLTNNNHQVVATTRETAIEHVRMLADLFVRANPLRPVFSADDGAELARRAAMFNAGECAGAVVELGEAL